MGHQTDSQDKLFYSFNLEAYVPQNHLLRGIHQFFDLSDLRQHLSQLYSHTGRPSIDPELMIRMLIIGYSFGIRSERRLCEEVHLNLAYRWFCRLGLEDQVPDHSTFSKNRHGRFRDGEVLRKLFETVLHRCMTEGLVRGEGFATDASIIKADVKKFNSVPGIEALNWTLSEDSPRAVREYLEAIEATNDTPSFTPKFVASADPASTWTGATRGPAFFAYCTNYLIDLKAGIIVDVEASTVNKTAEVHATQTMIDRVEDQFGMKPKRLVGDTNYGSADILAWLVNEKNIAPHVPVWDKSDRTDGTLSRIDFVWNAEADEYRCPEGKALRKNWRPYKTPRTHIAKDNFIRYRSKESDCAVCPRKDQCCPNASIRKIPRSVHEDARDVARQIALTPAYEASMRERKKVEMLFAHLKSILKIDKLRLRGFSGAQDEFLLAATAQNLRRMAKWLTPVAKETGLMPA
jgi:transposase